MKQQAFERAREINYIIDDIDTMLNMLGQNDLTKHFFNYEDEQEKFDAAIERYLQNRKAQLQKEFDKL